MKDKYIDRCHELDRDKALKLGGSIGSIIFFLNFTFFIAVLYGKKLIIDGHNKSGGITVGDVKTQQDAMNKALLYAYANSLDKNFGVTTFIPSYAKKTA